MEKELLAFPNGKNDDAIAALALLGMALESIIPADHPWQSPKMPKPGTMAWVKGMQEEQSAAEETAKAMKGW